MTRSAGPKLGAYAGLTALGLLAALALGLPELAVLAAPFALALVAGFVLAREPHLKAAVELDRERALEGESVQARLVLSAAEDLDEVEIVLELREGLAFEELEQPLLVSLRAGEPQELHLRLVCRRWGAYAVGALAFRVHDRFRLLRWEGTVKRGTPLKVYPREEALRALLAPLETQVYVGNQVAREKGEGIEFADLRPFVAGDRIRRVNWRASARRDELWVNEYHTERNAETIVFLDSFAEARGDRESTLDVAVRAAASLARGYLRHKDRVGLVSFGGVLNWLLPGTGIVQIYRLIDALLDTEILLNYAWKDIDVIPRRTLPSKALVIAVTPLLDERASRALLDLRGRGFDLAIVEISPLGFVEAGAAELDRVAFRLWRLRREALRGRFLHAGVPVAVWDDEARLVGALEEVKAFRRYARPVRA